MQYTKLAKLYDSFTSDKNNDEWASYIIEILQKNNILTGDRVLDICCGTGGKTYELYKNGYNVIGLDNSSDMLEIAAAKFSQTGAKIQLVCQDICNIKSHKKQNAIVCINDGINYITNQDDLRVAFTNIYNTLEKNGVFLFDISSKNKLESLHDKSFFEETEQSAYIWHNEYNNETNILTMDISLYSQIEEDLYEKSNEVHIQRAYTIEDIMTLLEETGFKDVVYYECFTFNMPKDNSHRIQFVAKK